MKVGVVVFPGSNCDQDMIDALSMIDGVKPFKLWHKDHDLQNAELVVLPGGFSYGDYLRSGAIARFSPIMKEVVDHANKGGPLFGVCNGFQILCEAHLVPGALLHNTSHKFICKNVFITPEHNQTMITQFTQGKGQALKIPIAHGEGRYFANEDELKRIEDNGQVIFRYCDEHGQVVDAANPNGSLKNIAGVCNAQKNVFGMMPHPERAVDPILGNTDGLNILKGLIGKVLELA
ncbi:MAG: phosphoribosylformylglycinamidine synthase subunit PurQ [Flavobacteriales bacterium]